MICVLHPPSNRAREASVGLPKLGVRVSQTRVWWSMLLRLAGVHQGLVAAPRAPLGAWGPLTNGLSTGSCNTLTGECHALPHCLGPQSYKLLPYLTFHYGVRVLQRHQVVGAGQLLVGNWILGVQIVNVWICVRPGPCVLFLKILFIFRQRGREGEKHQCVVASYVPPHWGTWPAIHAGMCPDWESNQQPFGSQAGIQSTEPHQPGPCVLSNQW